MYRRLGCVFLLCGYILLSSGCANPCEVVTLSEEIEEYQSLLTELRQIAGSPGLSVAILEADKEAPWVGVTGCMDVEEEKSTLLNASFLVGSVSKTVVAAIVLSLVDQGELSLEEEVPLSTDRFETPRIRDLLGMTTGLPDYVALEEFSRRMGEDPQQIWSREELIRLANEAPEAAVPQESWFYSNTNYLVLEKFLEERTGQTLQDHLEAMHGGAYRSLRFTHLLPREEPYAKAAMQGCLRAMCVVQGLEGAFHPSAYGAAGSLAGEPAELVLFIRDLFGPDGLSASSVDEMTRWNDTYGDFRETAEEYGLGLYVLPTDGEEQWWGHSGSVVGATSYLAIHEESGTVVLVASARNLDGRFSNYFVQTMLGEVLR